MIMAGTLNSDTPTKQPWEDVEYPCVQGGHGRNGFQQAEAEAPRAGRAAAGDRTGSWEHVYRALSCRPRTLCRGQTPGEYPPGRAVCLTRGGGASTTSSTEVSATWVSIPAVTAGRRPNKQKNQLFIHSVRLLRLS